MPFNPAAVVSYAPGEEYADGFIQQVLNGAVITATGNAGFVTVPWMLAAAKARLVVVASAVGGTSPSLTLNLAESVDGTNVNGTVAVTSGAITANGTTWGAVATGPFYNQLQVAYTVSGTGSPTFTVSAWLLAWNR